jgi:hypothetical protein
MFKGFQYKRMSLGIAIYLIGHPIIFFFRDFVGLARGQTWFTATCLVGGLMLMIPGSILRKFYQPNMSATLPLMGWITLSIFYLFFVNPYLGDPNFNMFRELVNYAMTLGFFFLLVSIPNDVKDHFVPVWAVFTFFGNIFLFYALLTSATYTLGARAAISFSEEGDAGNPHVFARNGFAGIFASFLLFKTRYIIVKLFAYFNLLFSIVTVLLTQTRSVLLSFLITIAVYCFFHLRPHNIKSGIRSLAQPLNLFVMVVIVGSTAAFIASKPQFIDLMSLYFETFTDKFGNVILTALGLNDDTTVDYSAAGRVTNVTYVYWLFDGRPDAFLLGQGYRAMYIDVPVVEALFDLGVLGGYFFGRTVYELLRASLRAIKDHQNPLTTFLGYLYVPTFVYAFTGGQPFDTSFLFPFVLMARFLGNDYGPPPEPKPEPAPAELESA